MRVQTVIDLASGQPVDLFVADTSEEKAELDALHEELKRPYPPPPGPDGLPYIRRVPPLPEGLDELERSYPWVVQLYQHPEQPIFRPMLCHPASSNVYPAPEDAPIFYTLEEGSDACDRAAIRLGILHRTGI